MKKYLALMTFCFLLSGPASAQLSMEQRNEIMFRSNQLLKVTESRAMEQCSSTRLVAPFPIYNHSTQAEATLEGSVSIEWSGGCVEGKRDGPGVLNWQSAWPLAPGSMLTMSNTAEGRFVKGQRLGMWCVTKYQQMLNGKLSPGLPLRGLGCSLLELPAKPAPLYIKQPDGSWQEYVLGALGATSLAAGELEAQSARLLADAEAGKTGLKSQVVTQSRDLDDLVRGSKIVMDLSAAPISLNDKRVAIVLSSQTVSEVEKFKRERQVLIDDSTGLRGEAAVERARFIQASNTDRLLLNILKVLKMHAKDAQPAADLAALKEGGFDYALVVDWKSMTRFDQLGKYSREAWPPKSPPAISGVSCESLRGFLIGRDLKVVKQLPAFPICQSDISGATGDQAYMWILATSFANRWGDLGLSVVGLNAFLKY